MGNGTGRYAALTKRLIDSVLGTPGHTTTELRRAVLARAFGPPSSPLSGTERETGGEDIPPNLAGYVDKVALHAYKVTDEDLVGAQRQLFEKAECRTQPGIYRRRAPVGECRLDRRVVLQRQRRDRGVGVCSEDTIVQP